MKTFLKVLIVEDHADTAMYLKRHFQNAGHEVWVADDLETAGRYLAELPLDFLLCDIALRDGDSWDLIKDASRETLYAVAMSGYGDTADIARSRSCGYRHHLVKPFSIRDLDDIVATAFVASSR